MLDRLIEDALVAMHRHPTHDLILGYRYAIKATFGPRYYPLIASDESQAGHRKRTLLTIKTTQHVLPLWKSAFPNNDTPDLLLEKARQVLSGKYSREVAFQEVGEAWSYMDSFLFGLTETDQAVAIVGYASVKAVAIAVEDEPIDAAYVNLDLTDEEIDAYDHDGAFEACLAYAGGPPWRPESSSDKRREFWEWWLLEAVPSIAG